MYNPAHFAETRRDVLLEFIQAHPFGMLITSGPDGPEASHIPFFLDASAGVLRCHMARANSQWQQLKADGRVLAIFSGVHHYITPNWYPAKRENGKVVPTWNYIAVHVTGTATLFEDTASLVRHVAELTDSQEGVFAEPWSVADAPADYVEGMTKAIVGIEIAVDRIEGKWKLSQNRSKEDQQGVIAGLEMAALMKDRKS